jgi:GDPmannose 4,6-dehydratase
MNKKAIITGILGQDGPYLAKLLLSKGYEVYGLAKKSNVLNLNNLLTLGIAKDITVIQGDVTDAMFVNNMIKSIKPDEIYNLAAQSSAGISWQLPNLTSQINAIGALNLLESIKNEAPECKFFQASSSDLFGNNQTFPLDENTPFAPQNPYAIAKLYAHWITVNYRSSFGLHTSNGILFNHESPLRSENFIISKIVTGAVKIKLGQQDHISMGGIDVIRDWGFAGDFVEAMWLMLQKDHGDNYLVCTGRPASFKEIIEIAFDAVGLPWEPYIKINTSLQRPTEVIKRYGNPDYIKQQLGWSASTSLETLIDIMIKSSMDKYK